MPLANGETFAGYRIMRQLGSGSMGQVYLARHPRLPRLYAIKVLPPDYADDPDYRERFNREADVAATFYHPHIVGVHDRGEDDGRLWISMDFVEGSDASQLLRERYPAGMAVHDAVEIITAISSALDYAHQQGCLHRDVKPANILLSKPDAAANRIMLADFGIARPTHDTAGLTATNMTVGTVSYAAPEQLMGEPLDGRADQYALAVTAYQLLTGSLPFENSNPVVVIGQHLNATAPALSTKRPELAALDSILAIALSKNPQDRFATCADFARSLTVAKSKGALPRTPAPPSSSNTMEREVATPTLRDVPRPSAADTPIEHWSPLPFPDANRRRRRRRLATVGTLAAILVIAAVALAVRPWQHGTGALSDGTPITTTAQASTLTFDGMREFVTGYYHDLPTRPDAAWAKLDAHCQAQTGRQSFDEFWATIESVTLESVAPRDATSVTARLTYQRRDGTTDSEDRWLKMALVNGAVLLDESGRVSSVPATTSNEPSAAPFQTSSIDQVLSSTADLERVTGASGLQLKNSTDQTMDQSHEVTPSDCVGVVFGAESTVYGDTGFVALRDQTFKPEKYPYNSTAPTLVGQTVIVFPSIEQAAAVMNKAQRQWRSCAVGLVHYDVPNTNGEVGWGFTMGPVSLNKNVLSVSMAGINNESGNNACQQVLGARGNVVVGARSCLDPAIPLDATTADPNLAGQNAIHVANEMLDRIHV